MILFIFAIIVLSSLSINSQTASPMEKVIDCTDFVWMDMHKDLGATSVNWGE